MTALPILDATAFHTDESSSGAAEFISALRETCHTVGFFYLTGHGVPDSLNQRVHEVSREFFASPESERLAISMENSPHFRGYTPPGGEHTNGQPDLRDEIDLGPEAEPLPVGPGDPAWQWLRGPNQWPAVSGFRDTVSAWMAELDRLGRTVLRGLALALGQPATRFDEWLDPTPEATAKLVRYLPPTADLPTNQGVGLHRDFGLLTFVYQDSVGGLQVERDGAMVDVPVLPGTFVVNLGEMLQLATHGYLKATVHRVVSPPAGVERISSIYFLNPRLDATLQPLHLPPTLAVSAPGGASADPNNPIFATYGENILEMRLRAHPAVARRHHAGLLQTAS